MHDPRVRASALMAGALALGLSSVAVGMPWDVDMADTQMVKGYEQPMPTLPEGVVAQPNLLSPRGFAANYSRMSPEGKALKSPLPNDEATLALGERMFGIYCTPCHGDGVTNGPVGEPGRYPGVVPLAGAAGIAKTRTDGWIYLTIRNGGAIMPYYGWAMSNDEMWSIVHYVRTLPGAQEAAR